MDAPTFTQNEGDAMLREEMQWVEAAARRIAQEEIARALAELKPPAPEVAHAFAPEAKPEKPAKKPRAAYETY